jgi:hypothetical protein
MFLQRRGPILLRLNIALKPDRRGTARYPQLVAAIVLECVGEHTGGVPVLWAGR